MQSWSAFPSSLASADEFTLRAGTHSSLGQNPGATSCLGCRFASLAACNRCNHTACRSALASSLMELLRCPESYRHRVRCFDSLTQSDLQPTCEACAAGAYSASSSASSCTVRFRSQSRCDRFKTCSAYEASPLRFCPLFFLQPCTAGSFQNTTGQTRCFDCGPGTLSASGAVTVSCCVALAVLQ